MSDDNVEAIRRLADIFDGGGWEAFMVAFAAIARSDVEWHEDPQWPDGSIYHGVDQIRGVFEERFESFDFKQETEELIASGDDVLALARWTGTGDSTGLETTMPVAILWTFRDAKVVRVRFYIDQDEARAAAGLTKSA